MFYQCTVIQFINIAHGNILRKAHLIAQVILENNTDFPAQVVGVDVERAAEEERVVGRLGQPAAVGGGDTLAAVDKYGVEAGISYISTGGGAFLEFCEGKELPAVTALMKRAH